ncbi:MAG: hypothetical protein GY761_04510 [Hyphomicrobiales bacterium]|nr:hypothetical protein [Hyphomicrobiales bacterium]
MQKKFTECIIAFGFSLLTAASALACEAGKEIWVNDKEGLRTVIYFPDQALFRGRLIAEGWKDNQIRWRVQASHSCSNGVQICGADIPLSNGKFMNASFEGVYENGAPKYLVSTQLQQHSYLIQNRGEAPHIVASWFVNLPPENEKPFILLPSVYKYAGCQKGDEFQAGKLDDFDYTSEASQIIRVPEYSWKPIEEEKSVSSFRYPVCLNPKGCLGTDTTINGNFDPDDGILSLSIKTPDGVDTSIEINDFHSWYGINFHIVDVDKSNSGKEIFISNYTGGAHCCTNYLVYSKYPAGPKLAKLASVDGAPLDSRSIETGVLILGDQNFLYAFGAYAGSRMPLKIFEISSGEANDITSQKRFRLLHKSALDNEKSDCAKGQNQSCAAYVATASILGEMDSAWAFMMKHHDPNNEDGWLPEYCDGDRDASGKCPPEKLVKFNNFPQALRDALKRWGYL